MSSPILLVSLLLAAAALSTRLYRAQAAHNAPPIPGHDWAKHPDALLLVYPTDDCGCGPSPVERVKEGLRQGRDVLVIAAKPSKDLEALRKAGFPPARFTFVTNASLDVIKRFSPKDQVASVQIQNGRIVGRAAG